MASMPIPDPPTRKLASWWPLPTFIGLGVAGGLLIALGADEDVSPLIAIGAGMLGTAIAWTGLWLGRSLWLWLTEVPGKSGQGQEAKSRWKLLPWRVLGGIGGLVFAVFAFGLWQKSLWAEAYPLCNQASKLEDLESKREAFKGCAEKLSNPWMLLPPEILDEWAGRRYQQARRQLEQMEAERASE